MNKNNVNELCKVPKNEVLNSKNQQIITRQGTKIGEDKGKCISTIPKKHDYPNLAQKREIFTYVSQDFKYLATQEDNQEHKTTKVN